MYKKLLKNSAIYGILPQLPKLASIFVLPLITPFLTKVDYGVIGTLYAYIGIFSMFQLLGLELTLYNSFFFYPKQHKWYWRQVFGFMSLWAIVYVSFLMVLIYFILPAEAIENRWLIIFYKCFPALFFHASGMVAYAYYLVNQKAWPIASRALFIGILGIGLNYYFIAHLKMGYMGWITADFIAETLGGIIFLYPVYIKWKIFPILNFKIRTIKKALSVSLPMLPLTYSSYILDSSDRLVMERLRVPTPEIGRYSLAYNFGRYADTITGAVNQAVGPTLLEFIKTKNWKSYEKLIFSYESLAVIICFTSALWSPQWLPILIKNRELLDIYLLVAIIFMSYCFKPLYVGCNQIAYYYEKTKVFWKLTLIASLINIVLNVIFIPVFGLITAAITTFVSYFFLGFAGFIFSHYKSVKELNLRPGFWMFFILILLLTVVLFLNASIFLKIGLNLSLILILIMASYYWNYLNFSHIFLKVKQLLK